MVSRQTPSLFLEYVKRNSSTQSSFGPLLEGKTYHDGPKKRLRFSTQYEGAFFKHLTDYSNVTFSQKDCPELLDLDFTMGDIEEAAKEMKGDSDGMPAYSLKEYIDKLALLLHHMRRILLDKGKMPEGICQSIRTPIFKGGSRRSPKDYHPVALTNHVTKIFERVLRKDIINHLERKQLINESHHVFRKDRSTTH